MPAILRVLGDLLKPPSAAHEPVIIDISGAPVTVTLRTNARAKRLVLRLAKDGKGAVLTVPKRVARHKVLSFLDKSKDWLEQQLVREQSKVGLSTTGILPLRGEPYKVVATGGRRGVVSLDHGRKTIHVPGDPAHVDRRLKDWLKTHALEELTVASRRYAVAMETDVKRISVRDQKSRWGSCSAAGDLSYSWRLILAPTFILEYVVAHEVAHRLHMNHGTRFWRLVMKHNPDVHAAKIWFRQHGPTLHHHLP